MTAEPSTPSAPVVPPAATLEAPDVVADVQDLFIQRWGDMGEVWGINRTMAMIQGLLYITGESLCTDDVMERLDISRGSASVSLRALVDWGVVRRVHRLGDRRDYYESLSEVWEIVLRVAQQRKRKEVDPILASLKECRAKLDAAPPTAGSTLPSGASSEASTAEPLKTCRKRLEEMIGFMTVLDLLAGKFIGNEGDFARALDLLATENPPRE
ncbi:MAG: GbsR/MarR family transcriptional regulator [Planctomycetia bacterium]